MVAVPLLVLAAVAAADVDVASASPTPLLRARLDVPVAWRTASVKPDIGAGVDYRTDTPLVGVELDVIVAPLHGLRRLRWLAPLELDVDLSQRFASVITSGSGGLSLSAREQRVSLDLLYPFAVGSMVLAGRAGYGLHRFAIDQDPIPPSTRHGVRIGVDATQPLPLSLAADAFARVFPTMGPGPDELAAFGPDGAGWGFQVGVAVRGPLAGAIGWRLGYDFLHFSDSYSGPGTRSVGGSGEASYHTLAAGVTFTQ